MNKQALAFLTMFSLILMLSVYYVTLPPDSISVMEETDGSKEETNISEGQEKEEDTSTSKNEQTDSDKLQEEINQKKEEELLKQSSVVADANSNDDTKKDALSTIDQLKEEQSLQKTVADGLKNEGYQNAVEIHEGICVVSIFEQKDDADLAKKIMNKVYELTNRKYLVELSFK